MSEFNLVDERWIPVKLPGGTREELGIRETLKRSHEIASIEDPSPLVVAALHRLLLAVLYRAIEGPADIVEAKSLLKSGLPVDVVVDYLEKWRNRFFLLDEKYPFFQVPDYEPKTKKGKKQWRSWSPLAAEHNADNNKVLFDHLAVNDAGSIPCKQAARWLLACQSFVLGGGNSDFVYTKSAPSATAVIALPIGKSLHDTLLFSLVPQNREVLREDKPVWERQPELVASLKSGPKRTATGYADLYTWQTRSIRFNPEQADCRISELVFASGVAFEHGALVDPMVSYRIDDKYGKLPLQFRERGIWRDFDSLLPDESNLAPSVVEHARTLVTDEPDRFPESVMVMGQANTKARIDFWRMERYALPKALAGDRLVREEIRELLREAEDASASLWKSCAIFAGNLIGRGERDPSKTDIKAFVDQMPLDDMFWSTLEARFHRILADYTLDKDSEYIRCQWLKSVLSTLSATWNHHRNTAAQGDVWTIRALVRAERPVARKKKELKEEIAKLEPMEATG